MGQNEIKLFKILFLLFLIHFCATAEDYYKTLGVSRNATPKEIRKAFKKLSLKWHPDKNKKNPEVAKNMFIKIANAYEVLSDPKKKEIYDHQGEEGVNDHVTRENSGQQGGAQHGGFGGFDFGGNNFGGGSFEDIFSQFFGGGGGGGRRGGSRRGKGKGKKGKKGKGGKQRGRSIFEDDEDEFQKGHFTNENIVTLNVETMSDLMNRREHWFVLFYKSNDRQINEYAQMWNTLADKANGIFTVSTVDCSFDSDVCEEYHIQTTPIVLYFPDSLEEEEVYKGIKTADAIFKFATTKMQDFVRVINSDNLENFIIENANETKVILFTQRKTTPPLLKALSKYFKNKLNFGEIRETEKELVKKFGIDRFPLLMVLTDPDNLRGVSYDGPLTRKELDVFLKDYAYPIGGRGAKKGEVKELDKLLYTSSKKCGEKDSITCFINLVRTKPDIKFLKKLADEFRKDPINIYYVVLDKYKNFYSAFDTADDGVEYIILKGKRKKYMSLKNIKNKDDIYNTIEHILDGGGKFKKLRKSLNFVNVRSDL